MTKKNTLLTNTAENKPVPIVAIGASAGGLEAVSELFRHLSPTTGMAFVYIQHLDPTHESLLSSLLGKITLMPVHEAEHEMPLQPNEVYIIPPNKDMEVVNGVLVLQPRRAHPYLHMPIDRFFVSLGERQKEGSIGIVLSGMGTDGTLGLKAIKMAGGITFAQNETARFQSMTKSAIGEGVVDMVMSPSEIAKEIERLSKQAVIFLQVNEDSSNEENEPDLNTDLRIILQLLLKSTGVDFSHYKMNTIQRRINRRIILYRLESLRDYAKYLREHPLEIGILYNDLLINVTQFFRDPETVSYLQAVTLPQLIATKPPSHPIRIWVPACSTGEEAYSLAMILMEVFDELGVIRPIQIFATDLSETAIAAARTGTYKQSDLLGVSPKRLDRFFTKEDDQYRIIKLIRDVCVFAPHNLFKDPPFSRLDLVSCCNLLIYLDNSLQKQAISIFHYALNQNGFLQLGKSETIGTAGALFSQVEKSIKIYLRKNDTAILPSLQIHPRSSDPDSIEGIRRRGFTLKETTLNSTELERTIDSLLLTQYVPPSVVVNQDLDILQFRGSTGLFLEPAPGKASLNLLKMARPDLVFELRSLVHKAKKTGKPIQKAGLELNVKNQTHQIEIEAVPLRSETDERLYLIIFKELSPTTSTLSPTVARNRRIKQLEEELALAREDMRSIIEDQEANNEELQSANEEIVSSNEELQSINEELETSKEEIESTNEELTTINQELQVRNDQLSEAHEYAKVIFGAIREATLMLDNNLRVRSANPAFYRTFNTREEDTEGQLIYELGDRQWNIPALRHLLETIIPKKNTFQNFEVKHTFPGIGEKVMLLNAQMVMQQPHRQEMILLVIEDITEHRQIQRLLEEREAWFHGMADNAPVLIRVAGLDGNYNFLNKTWLEFTGHELKEEVEHSWLAQIHPDDVKNYKQLYESHFEKRLPYRTEYRLLRHDGEYRWMLEDGKPLFSIEGVFTGYMGTCAEVHHQKMENEELEARVAQRTLDLHEANANLKRSNEELRQYAYVASHDLQEPLRKIVTFSGRIQKKFTDNLPEQGHEYLTKIVNSAQRMTRLIDDLLTFSRTIHQNKNLVPTDLNHVLQEVLLDFDLTISEKQATLQTGHLPTIEAIPLQMAQLFYNLVGNALKFTIPNNPPVISIEATPADKEEISKKIPEADSEMYWKIVIRDNGIGFDPHFSDQIFFIFQRLHEREAYIGTGIGLALCQRIVNNHNGHIYAEGKEGEGATFCLLLPEKQGSNVNSLQ
jgi:two-component system CheB/CheR fusion protein